VISVLTAHLILLTERKLLDGYGLGTWLELYTLVWWWTASCKVPDKVTDV
jgi:hypothetical protein